MVCNSGNEAMNLYFAMITSFTPVKWVVIMMIIPGLLRFVSNWMGV